MDEMQKYEKIETTYKEFYEMVKNNPDQEYFVETHKGELAKVNAAVEKSVDQMYFIEFEGGHVLECADTHAFMDRKGDPLFAQDLVRNNRILTKYGPIIVKSKKKSKNTTAYDINIDAPHWYVNDENGIIHHNTMLALYCMKAYLDKYPDGIALLYDSEFGVTPEYIQSFEIDIDRVVHIPIKDVEELKFDIVSKLDAIEKKDKVFIMIDSIGNLASKKELEDAQNEKSVADMSRAKSIKSLWRIVTPYLTTRGIPCIAINHIYKTQELYSKNVVSGGTGSIYSSNQIFIITKAQEKEGTELAGWKFTINIEKSRYVREKAKLPFIVTYEDGIKKWDAIFDMALEAGIITKPKMGWYQVADPETGEVDEKNYRQAQVMEMEDYFEKLIESSEFQKFIEHKYKLGAPKNNKQATEEIVDIDE